MYHAGLFKLVLTPVSFRGGTKLLRRAREATVTGPGRDDAGPVVLGRHGPGGDIAEMEPRQRCVDRMLSRLLFSPTSPTEGRTDWLK